MKKLILALILVASSSHAQGIMSQINANPLIQQTPQPIYQPQPTDVRPQYIQTNQQSVVVCHNYFGTIVCD